MKISEIQIIPIKPKEGLIGFASFVLQDSIYMSSIGIYTRPEGGYRLTYPTKLVNGRSMNLFHPINKEVSNLIEDQIFKKLEEVMAKSNDRYSKNYIEGKGLFDY